VIVVDACHQSCRPPPEVKPGFHTDQNDVYSTNNSVPSRTWRSDSTASNPNPVEPRLAFRRGRDMVNSPILVASRRLELET
jgi:hypothetical protein